MICMRWRNHQKTTKEWEKKGSSIPKLMLKLKSYMGTLHSKILTISLKTTEISFQNNMVKLWKRQLSFKKVKPLAAWNAKELLKKICPRKTKILKLVAAKIKTRRRIQKTFNWLTWIRAWKIWKMNLARPPPKLQKSFVLYLVDCQR